MNTSIIPNGDNPWKRERDGVAVRLRRIVAMVMSVERPVLERHQPIYVRCRSGSCRSLPASLYSLIVWSRQLDRELEW
jgi:hypothetical protein